MRGAVTAIGAGFRDTIEESFPGKVRLDADDAAGAAAAGLAGRDIRGHGGVRRDVVGRQPGRRRRCRSGGARAVGRGLCDSRRRPVAVPHRRPRCALDPRHAALPVPPSPSLPLQIAAAADGVYLDYQHSNIAARRRTVAPRGCSASCRARRSASSRGPARTSTSCSTGACTSATTVWRPYGGWPTPTSTRSRSIRAAACVGHHRPRRHAAVAPLRRRAHVDEGPRDPGARPAGRGEPACGAGRHRLRDLRCLPHVPHARSGQHVDAAHRPRARPRAGLAGVRHRAARPPGARSGPHDLAQPRHDLEAPIRPERPRLALAGPAARGRRPAGRHGCRHHPLPKMAGAISRVPTPVSGTPAPRPSRRPARASR